MAVWRKAWRWMAGLFAAAVLLLGLATGLFRLLVPALPAYQQDIERWASAALNVRVTLGSYDLRWTLAGPELVFYDGELWTPDGSERVLHADGGAVRLSLMDLARGRIRPSSLMLRGALIPVERDSEGDWRVLGRELPAVSGAGGRSVLPRGRLELRDATVVVADGNGPPLQLNGVQLEVERGGDSMRVDGALDLPSPRAGHLEAVLQSDVGSLDQWQVYVRGERFDLVSLLRFAPGLSAHLHGGAADFTLWAALDGRTVEEGSVVVDARNISLAAHGEQPVDYDKLRGRFGLARVADGWRVHGEHVEIARGGYGWPEASFRLDLDEAGRLRSAEADFLRLQDVAPLVAWLPDGALKTTALSLDARGEVQDLLYERGATSGAVALRAWFTDLGFDATERWPGLSGLNGNVRVDAQGGRVELESARLVADWPAVFRAPLPQAELRGALDWRREAQGWHVLSEELLMSTAQLRSRSQFELMIPADDGSPVIDLQVAVEDGDISAASHYLPVHTPAKVTAWLDAALRSGRVVSASAMLRGPVRAFPFDGGEGEFRARAQFEDTTLQYWSDWPAAERMSGIVEFHNAALSGQMRAATVGGNHVTGARVEIADLREGVIEYSGKSSGDVAALLAYLRASGLAARAPIVERGLESSGAGELDLDFSLPVRRVDGTRVRATLHLDGATVGVTDLRQRFERVEGAIEYDDAGVRGEGVRALFLGRPVEVSLSPERADDGHIAATLLDVRGRLDAIDLAAGLDPRLDELIAGSSVYRARARLPLDGSALEVTVGSDLAGTEINMPAPLAKEAEEPRPLDLHARFATPERVLVGVSVGDDQRALVEVMRGATGWRFARGAVAFGGGAPELGEPQGLVVRGHVDALDLGGWLDLNGATATGTPLLSFADLQIDELTAFGQHFTGVGVELDRNDREWLVRVAGQDLRGSMSVPMAAREPEPLIAKLEALHLRPLESGSDDATDPRNLRPMQVDVVDFSYGDMQFGRLLLDLTPVASGVQVTRLATTAPAFAIEGKGQWLADSHGHRSQFDLTLKSSDLRATLTALDFDASLAASDAEIIANVHWPGPPGPRFREQLAGDVQIRVGQGQLESVQPGAGRMFGLLSVAALPRRLSLDFRDVFEKGLAFDQIEGDFTLDGGDAYTNNLALQGPAADIGIVGRTGLFSHDYDQTAVVYANFGASLPVAGAIAGGPAVGAALLLFSEIFKKPLKAISRTHYRITGSWDDPLVERIAAPEGEPGDSARNARAAPADSLAEER